MPRTYLRFACDTRNPVFDVATYYRARRPAIFVLENVKNLKVMTAVKPSGIIMQTLDRLGCDVADSRDMGADDPKIIDGNTSLPQHRERVLCWSRFRRDSSLKVFTLGISDALSGAPSVRRRSSGAPAVDAKFILTPVL